MKIVEVGQVEQVMTANKMAEVAIRSNRPPAPEVQNPNAGAQTRLARHQADEYDIMPFQPSRTSSVKIHPPDGMGSSLTIVLPFQDSQYHPRTSIE
ncbi:hypothetical protein ACE6H2_014451 [Prunus campanulata]